MFRDADAGTGKRKREKERMDPKKSRRPELPVTGPGRGGRVGASATQHVVQNLVRDTTRDEDVSSCALMIVCQRAGHAASVCFRALDALDTRHLGGRCIVSRNLLSLSAPGSASELVLIDVPIVPCDSFADIWMVSVYSPARHYSDTPSWQKTIRSGLEVSKNISSHIWLRMRPLNR